MFTGLVQARGTVASIEPQRIIVDAPGVNEPLGASVAVDGCCLTVVASEAAPLKLPPYPNAESIATQRISFDVLPETLQHTRFANLRAGESVNLETALRAGDPFGGHIVQGHVDACGTVIATYDGPNGKWRDVELDLPEEVLRLCVERGSITVNGVSLTIMELLKRGVRVQLIPETQVRTNLGEVGEGGLVNVEADVIARYVARLMASSR